MALIDHAERLDGARAAVLGVRLVRVQAIDVDVADVDVGTAVLIQCAITRPRPPPVMMPIELRPGARRRILELGSFADDRRRSGVKLSGPQKNFFTPASIEIGTRAIAFSTYGPMRSQSGWISPNEKSLGNAPDVPRRAHRLEQADHQAADFLAEVTIRRRILEHGPVAADLRMRSVIR